MLEGVQILVLNSDAMKRPSPFDMARTFQSDGSNLPLMVEALRQDEQRFGWWLGHIQTILEDVEDILVEERGEDNARYLSLQYHGGLRVPAWLLSDGTLRLLALTLLAYLPSEGRVFMIEGNYTATPHPVRARSAPLLPAASLLEKGRNAVESPSPRRFAYGEGLPLRFR